MSKTIRHFVVNKFDVSPNEKRSSEAVRRFYKTQRRDTDKLFKREVAFTTWLERTSKDD